MWEILSILRVAFCKASKSVTNMSRRHQMLSFACISLVLWCKNRMQVQSHLHSRFPKSKKPQKVKKSYFFCIFSWYKFVTVSWKAFWKATKSVKNRSVGHQMLSIACMFSCLQPGNRMWVQNYLHSRFPTSKKPQKFKKITVFGLFWPYPVISAEVKCAPMVSVDFGCKNFRKQNLSKFFKIK